MHDHWNGGRATRRQSRRRGMRGSAKGARQGLGWADIGPGLMVCGGAT